MISEGDYFFRGAERLSWGFATPNYLGALAAGLIPFVWGLKAQMELPKVPVAAVANPRKRQKPQPAPSHEEPHYGYWVFVAILLMAELALWAVLGATGSRGAAVAALSGVVLWEAYRRHESERLWRQSAGWTGLRLLFCLLGFLVFSFGGRIALGYVAQDASIGNRWVLWSGGAALCFGSPWHGWGGGESGLLFTQWLQPLDRGEGYRTMVNSYLHLAVDRGLPSLGFALAVGASLVGWPMAIRRGTLSFRWAGAVRAAACVWATWATANVFSTLFDEPRLWYAPGIAALVLLASLPWCWRGFQLRWWVVRCVVAGGLVVPGLLWAMGAYWQWRASVRVCESETGAVVLSKQFYPTEICWGVIPDTVVLGAKYGHEIRRWAEASGNPEWSALICDSRKPTLGPAAVGRPRNWLVFGDGVERVDQLTADDYVVLVHPRGLPPSQWRGTGLVLLNQIDEEGSAEEWDDWAGTVGMRIYRIPDTGLDALSVWPQAYAARLEAHLR